MLMLIVVWFSGIKKASFYIISVKTRFFAFYDFFIKVLPSLFFLVQPKHTLIRYIEDTTYFLKPAAFLIGFGYFSFVASSTRLVWITPLKPQSLHLLLGLPTPFEPFLTRFVEPYLRHVNYFVIIMQR